MNCLSYQLPFFSLLLLLLGLAGCTRGDAGTAPEEDKLLAEVFNKQLYLSELEGIFQPGMSQADSSQLVNTYIEKWVRDNLLLHEAEKNIPLDLNIDELVRNYRASLVRHNFEKLLVESQLDSMVAEAEITAYFDKNHDQYKLKNSIVRCFFIKIPLSAPGIKELDGFWNNRKNEETYFRMLDYANAYAQVFMLQDSSWYEVDYLMQHLPKDELKNSDIKDGKHYRNSDDQFRYYLQVFERISVGREAPLEYVRGQITQLLLHQRKIRLLEKRKESLYEKEIRANNIKIYTN